MVSNAFPSSYSLISPITENHIQEMYEQSHDQNLESQKRSCGAFNDFGDINPCMTQAVVQAESDLISKMKEKAVVNWGVQEESPIQIWDAANTSSPKLISQPYSETALVNFNNLKAVDSFFRTVHGRPAVANETHLIRSFLNHPQAFNNAFWSPKTKSIYYGNVDSRIFTPLVNNQEIATHELGHAVTNFSSDLEYLGESGALNESLSDVFAITHKHFLKGTNSAASPDANWLIGEGVVVNKNAPNSPLRSMSNPGTAYKNHPFLGSDPQPDHKRSYVLSTLDKAGDWGGVHTNSGIPNRAFYLAAYNHGGPSWEVIGKIWYQALISSNKHDQFSTFADRTLQISKTYGGEVVQIVGKAWTDVGVDLRVDYQMIKEKKGFDKWKVPVYVLGGSIALASLIAYSISKNEN